LLAGLILSPLLISFLVGRAVARWDVRRPSLNPDDDG
jgi:hypothetical protein